MPPACSKRPNSLPSMSNSVMLPMPGDSDQHMTVVQHLVATGPAATGHCWNLLDLSSGLVELDDTLTIEGDDPPVGQSAGRDDLAHGHPQNVLAARSTSTSRLLQGMKVLPLARRWTAMG